jgi:hypothetical protein
MAANTDQLGQMVAKAITPAIANMALIDPEFYIENISLPDEVEAMLDKRTSMGIVGDLNRFTQYSAAEALGRATVPQVALWGGHRRWHGHGHGRSDDVGLWRVRGAPPRNRPLRPPPRKSGISPRTARPKGPFSTASLGRMVADGSLTRDTTVWTPGQDGWKTAGDVTELARLFTVMPPPPPAPPAKG